MREEMRKRKQPNLRPFSLSRERLAFWQIPLVFVFIGLLPFTELAMKLEVRDMPGSSSVRSRQECLRLEQHP